MSEPLLDIRDLTIAFKGDAGLVEVTDRVGFQIQRGEIFGLVGESGCGKTVTSLAILRLLPLPAARILSGSVRFKGVDLLTLPLAAMRQRRGRAISMIFQEPGAALNPLLRVRRQIFECFAYHAFQGDRAAHVQALLKRVGFADPERILSAFPHELSGGMQQRIMIAMALLLGPDLVIADEPTTALDVTVQAQIMTLLTDMQRETGSAVLLITHNLGLIAQYAHRLAVMYAGRIVEEAPVAQLLANPRHPYTHGLLQAIPDLNRDLDELRPIPGQVPAPEAYEPGCRFRNRCARALPQCVRRPALAACADGHRVACFLHHSVEAA